jgi:hypothetical protein
VCGAVRARQVTPQGSRVGRDGGRRGEVHGGVRLDAMGGGERGARGRLTKVRVGSRRW